MISIAQSIGQSIGIGIGRPKAPLSETNLYNAYLSSAEIDERIIYWEANRPTDYTLDIRGNGHSTFSSYAAALALVMDGYQLLEDEISMDEVNLYNLGLFPADIDARLNYLAGENTTNETIDVRDNGIRTAASDAAVITLTNLGCQILQYNT